MKGVSAWLSEQRPTASTNTHTSVKCNEERVNIHNKGIAAQLAGRKEYAGFANETLFWMVSTIDEEFRAESFKY